MDRKRNCNGMMDYLLGLNHFAGLIDGCPPQHQNAESYHSTYQSYLELGLINAE